MGIQKCKLCTYWDEEQAEENMGVCRYYPPKVIATSHKVAVGDLLQEEPAVQTHWPVTFKEDWCGKGKR